jgi:benzylsuccinate CoA-transferase BbsE subunit
MAGGADRTGGALTGLRVIDLSDERGQYCGKLFADMGADVILVEPRGGSPARQIGPFVNGCEGPDSSIPFLYENAGKRSIVLDLESGEDAQRLRRLVSTADLLIDTARPGALDVAGFGHDALRALRPALVQVSITPFGQTGPWAGLAADDLTLCALGGFAQLGGYPDAAPQVAYGDQAYHAASLFAAVSAMAALLRAEMTGEGEYIDVSTHESIVMAMENAAQFYDLEGVVRPRAAGHRVIAGQLPCKDGYVYVMAGGVSGAKSWGNVVNWLQSEDAPGSEELSDPRWQDGHFRHSAAGKAEFERIFSLWSMSLTRAEIEKSASAFRIPMAVVAEPADVLASEQLAWRGFFVDLPHPASGRTLRVPGAPYRLEATPAAPAGPAPAIDADRAAILAEIVQCQAA